MAGISRLTDGQELSTERLRELLKRGVVEVGRFVSLGRGTATVEVLQDDRPPVTVTVLDRE